MKGFHLQPTPAHVIIKTWLKYRAITGARSFLNLFYEAAISVAVACQRARRR